MATVQFKAKVERPVYVDGSVAPARIKVPALDRKHCDMSAFRKHPKYGSYANSDLFRGMLARAANALGVGGYLLLDNLPPGVAVDTSGFLAVVSFEL